MGAGIDAERHDPYVAGVRTEVAVARVRAEVAALHAELVDNGLVVWTGGNVSARVPGADLFVIKPSDVSFAALAPENMIVCDLDGVVVEGTPGSERAPSSDAAAHAYVYRNMPEVGGVVHTHSTYAAAWATRAEAIPCVTITMAEEFGESVPVGPLAVVGDESIGRGIVETLRDARSRAVLMRNHGPFTLGVTPREAVRTAVILEDAARTVHIARDGGELAPLPTETIDDLFSRRTRSGTQTTDERRPSNGAKRSSSADLLRSGTR
ncbi:MULTISPECIES: L-ribulose-5-phosphate 4-epimerase [unclassified Microbacterium]|uniref:L-ribulose-5-phosphate 4-epimerase n=1 Tax=unclassified Microbacterium TaxID=2609290 RepID=UPI003745DA0F